ncbi:RTA1-like protein [Mycena chlorophos]|uniref:RTA1-like protein n=1 Tax=Mycena chlorophos TaxID=658473 RepID=A0A8H6T8I8_MYCCL|nr:RTA1-like protein [Mycena chlorophos]
MWRNFEEKQNEAGSLKGATCEFCFCTSHNTLCFFSFAFLHFCHFFFGLFMSTNGTVIDPTEVLSAYGYVPTRAVAVIFLILFGMSTAAHLGQAIWFRMWWLIPTAVLCGLGELVGWSGRYWSSFNPAAANPYMMQITTTIIAPTPLIAVNFIVLGRIIRRLGPCYSRLSPRAYTRIFLSCDLIALVIQGAGGGIAASANSANPNYITTQNLGGHIMLVGIIFQFVALCTYSFFGIDFVRHYHASRPVRAMISSDERGEMTTRVRLMLWALVLSTSVLFVRSVYRIIELADGWTGTVITTQVYFNLFDGGMVITAIWAMNIAHPGLLLGRESGLEAKDSEKELLKLGSANSSHTNFV